MRVLVVEDHQQYAGLICEKLAQGFQYDVELALTPDDANGRLAERSYDVVVVDVLYRALSESYNAVREAARNSLSELEPYNLSGLATLHHASTLERPPAAVIWTSGDPNRALHLVLAHQEFRVRSYCSKESSVEEIARAIEAAAARRSHVDSAIKAFLPRPGLLPIREVLFGDTKWRAIWRALAAGSTAHEVTARMTHYDQGTIRKCMSPMALQLATLDPRINPRKQQMNVLSSYAVFHWEFFLDQAVHELFPHSTTGWRA
ncbi:hypothetical protein GCM10010172_43290 [Paractinoplanes ferrugineus]|uniref:Response regulatory domain-containing protein n=1 Tax=Paractinoplanes ferrugineus TaxID=113564 RepID=A0A919MMQ0_9ACTN|nr:hypothetical protein [Actinoplanes ferrugineus]GIE13487.1 hypothetical protein Afe05nite_53270 [Actinoplanes ferrugineus]